MSNATTEPDTASGTAVPDVAPDVKAQADKLVAEGKKAIALKDWEAGVEKYAGALDLMRQLVGDFDPAMAPLLLSYGKALYELAFASQGVMGKEEVDKVAVGAGPADEDGAPGPSSSKFVFGGDEATFDDDAEDVEEPENAEAGPSTAAAVGDEGEEGEGEAEEGADEPEDDYNAAWEVLDVARTIYAKSVEGKSDTEAREDKLNLAETYLALGDVSLETENFAQAVQDYTEALRIKSALLPPSSRALASVHYQLTTVLEFTPAGRDAALSHVQKALAGFQARLAELSNPESAAEDIAKLSDKERESEKKDAEGLIEDLQVKIEELKQAPVGGEVDIVKEGVNHLLGGGLSAFGAPTTAEKDSGPVNDLTSMVKKKKKPAAAPTPVEAKAENGEKRKAEEADGAEAKKAKVE